MSVAVPERFDTECNLDDLAAGKPEAFEAFFESWFPRVHRFAASRSNGRSAAERVTERVLQRAVEELCQGGRPDDVGRWLLARLKAELAREDVGGTG